MKYAVMLAAFSTLAIPQLSYADSNKVFSVGVNAGTRGLGFETVFKLSRHFNLRGSYSQFDIDESFDEDGIEYDGEFELKTTGLMLDYHPFAGSFRITGGLFNNGTILTAAAQASNGTVNINGFDYQLAGESVDIKMDWDPSSPYVGIGWGNSLGAGSNFTFSVDLGVLLTDEPLASLTATQGLHDNAAALGRNLSADLAAEEAELNDDLSDFDKYPVLQIGLSYAF